MKWIVGLIAAYLLYVWWSSRQAATGASTATGAASTSSGILNLGAGNITVKGAQGDITTPNVYSLSQTEAQKLYNDMKFVYQEGTADVGYRKVMAGDQQTFSQMESTVSGFQMKHFYPQSSGGSGAGGIASTAAMAAMAFL